MICYDREFPESARILMIKGAELILVPNACPMEINRLSQLRGRAYENMLVIATCNYPALYRGCNGHSTLFDGVIYNTETGAPRDMLVSEAGDEEGVFLAELDVDMLRKYRSCEIGGLKNRRPELYRLITEHIEV
jgi:predicted amidohydrolase